MFRTPRPLEGSWLDEIAQIYRACALVGITPLEADELELWQIGAAIGANDTDDDKPGRTNTKPPRGPNPHNVRRILALEAGLPQPTHDTPLTPAERQRIAEMIGTDPGPKVAPRLFGGRGG